ncbi:MAG: OsmC family protein [Nakamurella sp.]
MTTAETAVNNGVDTAYLLGARAALSDAPAAAEFVWRAHGEWSDGTHFKASVKDYFGLGEEQTHLTEHKFETDHPGTFGSKDRAVTPVEYVLVGLGGCLTAGIASVAQNRGIQLKSVKATIEGGMNVLGILGGDPDVRNGFTDVTVNYEIDADASQADIEALVAQSQKRSAVFDIIANPTNITVNTAKVTVDTDSAAEVA